MKLSGILKDWPEKREEVFGVNTYPVGKNDGFNDALTFCDREIDREALANIIRVFDGNNDKGAGAITDHIISTMPTWLKRSEK